QDRYVAAGSQPSTDLEAVQARHEHVQHHQVRLNLERLAQTFAAIGRQRDLIALVGQRPPERRSELLVVVDYQHSRHTLLKRSTIIYTVRAHTLAATAGFSAWYTTVER